MLSCSFTFFSYSDFWRWTPTNANVLHVAGDVQVGCDYHFADWSGRTHPQGRDHWRDTAGHSLV